MTTVRCDRAALRHRARRADRRLRSAAACEQCSGNREGQRAATASPRLHLPCVLMSCARLIATAHILTLPLLNGPMISLGAPPFGYGHHANRCLHARLREKRPALQRGLGGGRRPGSSLRCHGETERLAEAAAYRDHARPRLTAVGNLSYRAAAAVRHVDVIFHYRPLPRPGR